MGPVQSSSGSSSYSGSNSSSSSGQGGLLQTALAASAAVGKPSVGLQSISKGGTITVSIGQTSGSNTVITFPDGSTASTANANPPDPPVTVSGFGGSGQPGYSVITLFTIAIN